MDARRKQKIDQYFDKVIDPVEFTRSVRRFMHETIKMTITPKKYDYTPDPDWINDGMYFLNGLCETLHPVLEEDDEEDKTVNDFLSV